jgi:RNA polymerase-binding transcription factor DksA
VIDQHHRTIKEIDAALHRLNNRNYGVSETTGEPITYARLVLIPWARTGVDDMEQQE